MSKTIFVGCKLPHGLLCEVPVEGRDQPVTFKLKGQWVDPGNGAPHILLTHGTTQVDADLYGKWLQLNADSDAVKGGFVFEDTSAAKVADAAEERDELKHGLEQQPQGGVGTGVDAKTDD